MEYLSIQEFADKWNISKRRIQTLCKQGRLQDAKMIGNMWLIPQTAERPADARVKDPVKKPVHNSSARKELKAVLKQIFLSCEKMGIAQKEQRNYALTAIAASLYSHYLNSNCSHDDAFRRIYRDISGKELKDSISRDLMEIPFQYVEKCESDAGLDNILSWAYQYSNKMTSDNIHSQTQFFTEKYMIVYLIQNIPEIDDAEKILDPCLGGGNFFVEYLQHVSAKTRDDQLIQTLISQTGKLYGYDIDNDIARVAVVNIRLGVLSALKKRGAIPPPGIWEIIRPNIFISEEDQIEGSLAKDDKCLTNILSGKTSRSTDILRNADVVLTNPPFATMKGMKQEQKDFLKKNYPKSNCDTCVAFLEAIRNMLNEKGVCGIVSQSAWMHLKSFQAVRHKLTDEYGIRKIVNLGSGAFQDLSGEKSNVSLMVLSKERNSCGDVSVLDLTACMLHDKIRSLENPENGTVIPQGKLNGPNGFDFTERGMLKTIAESDELYKNIAVPMQGTSTGNAKELVGYFWEHFDDKNWIPVSNGGGYCRWQGLNDSVVKWGENGEFIKAQKGSSLRNVKYFPETKMVFSDTGTAGLNVRILLDGQIFIASGPGIRVTKGNKFAHLALLNSRIAAYYVRTMSPKLTIAAGYIGQIPVKESIYTSVVLAKNARLCIALKKALLSTRPNNLEYQDSYFKQLPSELEEAAWYMFNEDITNELLKLEIESRSDQIIIREFGFTAADETLFRKSVGECAYAIERSDDVDLSKLDQYLYGLMDASCCLKRTRTSRGALGCDGILEYISKDLNINPEHIVSAIQENPKKMKKVLSAYKDLILHNAVLYYLGYNTSHGICKESLAGEDVIAFMETQFLSGTDFREWLLSRFNAVHKEIFKGTPYLTYRNGELLKA